MANKLIVDIKKSFTSDPFITESEFEKYLDDIKNNIRDNGHLIIFPTETVYGLGGNIYNRDSIMGIFTLKKRPLTDPLICHVADVNEALKLYDQSSKIILETIRILGVNFWPGPLSIVAKASSKIIPEITANSGYVCVRCPNHPVALSLLKKVNVPLAAPSANQFGHISPSNAIHAFSEFKDCDSLASLNQTHLHVIDGHNCVIGIESTVCKIEIVNDCELKLSILRLGNITPYMIEQVIRDNIKILTTYNSDTTTQLKFFIDKISIHSNCSNDINKQHDEDEINQLHNSINEPVTSPGMLITHYSPNVLTCLLIPSSFKQNSQAIEGVLNHSKTNFQLSDCVILDPLGQYKEFKSKFGGYLLICEGNTVNDKIELISMLQRHIFNKLREAEALVLREGKKIIGIIDFYNLTYDLGDGALAVYDRLFR